MMYRLKLEKYESIVSTAEVLVEAESITEAMEMGWGDKCGALWESDGSRSGAQVVLRGIDTVPGSKPLPVAVVDEESATRPGDRVEVIARFATVEEAEEYVDSLPDRAKVERGGYGIDDEREGT